MALITALSTDALLAGALQAIRRLRAQREFETRHLPAIRTLEDRELICEIGIRQSRNRALSMKQSYLLGLGSVATVQRRLQRLCRAGYVRQERSRSDRRVVELTLTPRMLRALHRYGDLLG